MLASSPGETAACLRRLFRADRRGRLRVVFDGCNYELIYALLQKLSPQNAGLPKRSEILAQWRGFRNDVCRGGKGGLSYEALLEKLRQALVVRQGVAESCGYSCWAEMKLRRQTSEGKRWSQVPLLLQTVSEAVQRASPESLRGLSRRKNFDDWLGEALQVRCLATREENPVIVSPRERGASLSLSVVGFQIFGRGEADVAFANWFPERVAVERLVETLAETYGLKFVPLLKSDWRGFGR